MISEVIDKINNKIYAQFPYLDGIKPEFEKTSDGLSVLKYSGSSKTADGHVIPITIKVKISADGEITQITSSR
jgi:hypothetical protein